MADKETMHIAASRKEAIEKGMSRYFGRPCTHGHGTIRATSGCHCVECKRLGEEKRSEKYRPRRIALERVRYAANPGKFIAKTKRYYDKNADQVRARRREYHYESYVDEEVRKKAVLRTKKWVSSNPVRAKRNAKVAKHKRRAAEYEVGGSFSAEDIARIYKAQHGKCAYFSCCGTKLGESYHADHIVPLSRGGANDRSNLQLTCAPCNLAKAARDPIVHAQSLGMLL